MNTEKADLLKKIEKLEEIARSLLEFHGDPNHWANLTRDATAALESK